MGSRRTKVRIGAAIAASCCVAVSLWAPGAMRPSSAAGRYRTVSIRVAPGVKLSHIVDRRGPNRIRVLRIDPQQVTVDVALAKRTLPGLETTSRMARRHGAIAAINGDYFLTHGHRWMGRPVNTYAEDAELKASPIIWGRNYAMGSDQTTTFMGHFPVEVTLLQHDTGEVYDVADWNEGGPRSGRLAGFTPAGGSSITPPRDTCAVRLYPTTGRKWHPTMAGVVQDFVVDVSRCDGPPMARRGGLVVAGRFDSRGILLRQSMLPGETVRLTWSLGLPGVVETIGGNPLLMEDGRLAAGKCSGSSFCMRHPRTGIGMTDDGTLLLVVVDGRWKKRSVGMTPAQFARLFRHLGANDAINLDGGGSSTMVVRDRIVNRPSDGHERKVGNALLILPGTDPQEPAPAASPPATPTPYVTLTPTTSPTATPSPTESGLLPELPPTDTIASACLSALDPASVGGYFSALLRGSFGRVPRARPGVIGPIARIFEGAQCPRVTHTDALRHLVTR